MFGFLRGRLRIPSGSALFVPTISRAHSSCWLFDISAIALLSHLAPDLVFENCLSDFLLSALSALPLNFSRQRVHISYNINREG